MEMYFARQAVYTRDSKVYGYDIIFNNEKRSYNKELAEKRIKFICNCGTVGLNHFTNNKRAFVNFTTLSLMEDIPDLLGKDNVIVQLNENIIYCNEVLESIKALKEKDYIIAYEVGNNNEVSSELIQLIDIFKIGFIEKSNNEIKEFFHNIREKNNKACFLASGLIEEKDYKDAIDIGFTLFQGQYFSNPTVIHNKEIAVRNSNKFKIIVELLNDNFEISRVEYIIKSDLSISYKLIRFLNSSVFGFVQSINSIKQAIMLLGKEELRRWLTLIVVSEMKANANEELITNTIIRGRFCELVCKKVVPHKSSKAFLVGLFSNLDLLIDKPMEDLVDELQVEEEVKNALINKDNILKDILNLINAYEKMEVKKVEEYSKKVKIDKRVLFDLYSEAIDWLSESRIN